MDNHDFSLEQEVSRDAGGRLASDVAVQRRRSPMHYRRLWQRASSRIQVDVVSSHDDLEKAFAVRAAVYMGEMGMKFGEDRDGNDLFATHVLARVNGEPVGCMRIRFFGEFAKPERLAVLPAYRKQRFGGLGIAHALAAFSFDYCARKGYRRVIGHAKEDLVSFWASFGVDFEPMEGPNGKFSFAGYDTVVMVGTITPPDDAITLDTPPLVMLQREGAWAGGAIHA